MFMFMPVFVQSGNGQCLPREIQRCCLYIGNLRVSNSFLHQSGLGLGLGLGYVWGCVLGKETLYGSYMVSDVNLGVVLGYGLGYGLGCALWKEPLYFSYTVIPASFGHLNRLIIEITQAQSFTEI